VGGLRRRVLKFGGTSVGTAAALRSALEIAEAAARERPVVVVVSALSGVTNALEAALSGAAAGRLHVPGFAAAIRGRHLALLAAVAKGAPARRAGAVVRERAAQLEARLSAVSPGGAFSAATRAGLLSLGERLSVPIVEAALRARGVDAHAVDGASLIRTDGAFAEAAVDYPATRRLTRTAFGSLGLGAVPVVTGFVAATAAGETTVLGRGGSDLTAAVLGWAVDAERVEIWSDVDGVMTADPRLDPGARTIGRLSYGEATALARGGAKVLHPRTLEPLADAGIPVFVGNTWRPGGPGTWIGPEPAAEAQEAGTAA
jgi:aspartate kinase